MENLFFSDSSLYTWVILPLLIFSMRVFDVSLGTFRIIFISRGMKYLSALVSFIEILIWLLAISQVFRNLNNIACYIAYAGGFASGSFLGVYLAEKMAMGKAVLRIITAKEATELVDQLKANNYGVTTLDAQGISGPVKVIFSIIEKKDLRQIRELVQKFNPNAFYSVEDVRFVSEGIFPQRTPALSRNSFEMFRPHKKGK